MEYFWAFWHLIGIALVLPAIVHTIIDDDYISVNMLIELGIGWAMGPVMLLVHFMEYKGIDDIFLIGWGTDENTR